VPNQSDLEEAVVGLCRLHRLPAPTRQYRAVPARRWKWDLAWPDHSLLMEVDGGTFVYGGHNRGVRIDGDAEKQSAAAALGWRCMRVTKHMIDSGRAIELLEEALKR
jgi:very-short-patch-repair endonuclease